MSGVAGAQRTAKGDGVNRGTSHGRWARGRGNARWHCGTVAAWCTSTPRHCLDSPLGRDQRSTGNLLAAQSVCALGRGGGSGLGFSLFALSQNMQNHLREWGVCFPLLLLLAFRLACGMLRVVVPGSCVLCCVAG